MVKFVQAIEADILSIIPQGFQDEPEAFKCGRDAFEKGLVPLDGLAMAIRDEHQCIGAYGLIEMWPGVARIWALFSEALLTGHPQVLGLHAKRDLKRADELGFHRIEATCDPDHEVGVKFLEWLGFEREGLMRRYDPGGNDSVLYARVRNES